jgi:5'-nucleotidase
MVIRKYGRPIGIIGVTTTFPSNWGKLRILPEAQAVKDEAAKMKAEGINIVIVLSHCGLEVDREIAQNAGDIDIIVGGHSHSFLYSGDNPPGPDRPVDTYPTVEKQENGHEVLIVQASAYTKYLGDITLYFDEEGIVKNYEGAPIFLGNDVVPDPAVLAELAPWKAGIDEIQNKVIGTTKFDLIARKCYVEECVMGDLMADVMAAAVSFKLKVVKTPLQIPFSLVS